jgi:type II secretion system protein N
MASLRETLEAPIPRPLFWVGTPVLGLSLVLLFMFLGFPYSDLIAPISQQIEQSTGSEIRIDRIEAQITRGGPGFSLHDLRLSEVGNAPLNWEVLKVRPAWSTSWFRGDPAFAVDLTGPSLALSGIVTAGDDYGFAGEVQLPDLSLLPLPADDSISLSGAMTAVGDLSYVSGELQGTVAFEAEAGSAAHPSFPMALAFDSLSGRAQLGGEVLLTLEEFEFDGPIISARTEGTVAHPDGAASAALDLAVELEVANPAFQTALSAMGIRIGRDGRTTFDLGGTLQNPVFR